MLKIDTKHTKHKKLFVATPMFGGNCTGLYAKSCLELQKVCDYNDISIDFYYIFNESLITRARNYCVAQFLKSDCTHMMFIDGDISFDAKDAIKMLLMCDEKLGVEILTAPYPKKMIAWDNVKSAVENGYADDDPSVLSEFASKYAFNVVDPDKPLKLTDPTKVKEGATGFMMIARKVFTDYESAYPHLNYISDHQSSFAGQKITAFFDTGIDEESKRYLSEDYMFSHNARKIGKSIWMCPWMKLNHVGTTVFKGNMQQVSNNPKVKKTSKKNLTKLC